MVQDLQPMNCKRSKWELVDPGSVEDCRWVASVNVLTTFLKFAQL